MLLTFLWRNKNSQKTWLPKLPSPSPTKNVNLFPDSCTASLFLSTTAQKRRAFCVGDSRERARAWGVADHPRAIRGWVDNWWRSDELSLIQHARWSSERPGQTARPRRITPTLSSPDSIQTDVIDNDTTTNQTSFTVLPMAAGLYCGFVLTFLSLVFYSNFSFPIHLLLSFYRILGMI